MIELNFKPSFIRQLNKLDNFLVEEVLEKIELLRNPKNHKILRVHKLHGRLNKFSSFSVNYKIRIVFEYITKKEVALLDIDDHDICK